MSSIPSAVSDWFTEQGFGEVERIVPVSGGCINNGISVSLASGETFFVKTNMHAPVDMFAREAEGLQALEIDGGPRIPKTYLVGENFLVLEELKHAPKTRDYDRTLGRQLAVVHQQVNQQFGFEYDNYIGSTPQPNPWTENGYAFYGTHRLGFQAELATQKGLLSNVEVEQVSRIASRLSDLIPKQPATLLHGDLWSGNVLSDENGQPALIDPAVYYGWAEADLAMTTLFGGFGADFFSGYQEVRPLEPGYAERFSLYNLYHLLNHLNLFGSGYHAQVKSILNRYG